MMFGDAIVRSVEVAVDPATAFEVFTTEIEAWFQDTPYSWNDPKRAVGIRFEPHPGGRWLEVWDRATGEGYEMGRIRVWEPGRRLVMSYRSVTLPAEPLTEIEVRFEPVAEGTRVTLEHRGWDRLPPEHVERWSRRAWIQLMRWFQAHLGPGKERSSEKEAAVTTTSSIPAPQAFTPSLCCKGAAAAIDFYQKAFGAEEMSRWTDPSGKVGHAEIKLNGFVIMLADEHPENGFRSPTSLGGTPVFLHLFVSDVDAVARAAVAAGAILERPVADQEYGDRNGKLVDPFGHVWMVATRQEELSTEEIQQRVKGDYVVTEGGAPK